MGILDTNLCAPLNQSVHQVELSNNPLDLHVPAVPASTTLYFNKGGCYVLHYVLTGNKEYEYNALSPQVMWVYYNNSALDGPSLASAEFSSSGSQIYVTFGSETDRAQKQGVFPCQQLLDFEGSTRAGCRWSNSTTVVVVLDSKATVVPGDDITLVADTVKARCPPRRRCDNWPYSAASTASITSNPSPVMPSAEIAYAPSMGYCSELVVDASRSTGGGGRSLYYKWTVKEKLGGSIFVENANISSYLNTKANPPAPSSVMFSDISKYKVIEFGLPRLAIPNVYLKKSAVYEIILTLANFMGGTTYSQAMYINVVGELAIPSVKISPFSTSISRSEPLSLFADAKISKCSSATSLSYTWRVGGGGVSSSSSDPRYFRVGVNKLQAGKTYSINCTVTDNTGVLNSASATVIVKRSAIDVAIAGGNRVIGSGTPLVLDASSSIDPDSDEVAAKAMRFNWTCTLGGSSFGQPCLGYASDGISLQPLTIAGVKPSVGFLPQGAYIFSVVGTTKDGRTASASATITVVAGRPPSVNINIQCDATTSTTCSLARINPSKKLTISGYANISSTSSRKMTPYVSEWTNEEGVFNDGKSLKAVTSSPLSNTAQAADGMLFYSLVIKQDSFMDGSSYTFRLRVTNKAEASSSAYAEISFTTNAAPTSGTFAVTPSKGYVLTTSFSLIDEGWVDDADDYPLSYSFYYTNPSDTDKKRNTITSGSLYASTSTILPEVRVLVHKIVLNQATEVCYKLSLTLSF